jgi:hydroxyacylglutathione hydrolase
MFLRQFLDRRHGCASYLVACGRDGDAAVVDPGVDPGPYERMLTDRGFRLRYVVDTHVHADHVSGARALARGHGADLCLPAAAPVAYPHRALRDGDVLPLGSLRLEVVHTPGHRPELISLLLVDPGRSPDPFAVMTGDSLLPGDAGRPDFAGGDAAAQHASLARLLALPDWVTVLPGHVEGSCGAAMTGVPTTTIGYERRANPLAGLDREDFVARLAGHVPARPLNQVAIEATNRGDADLPWAMLTADPVVPRLAAAAVDNRAPGSLLLDVREPEEFADGHVPGAVNVPQAELATWLVDATPDRDREVVLICQSGRRSLLAAQFLAQQGFGRVATVDGGIAAWEAAGGEPEREPGEAPIPAGSATARVVWPAAAPDNG